MSLRRRSARGAATIEFALFLPVLVAVFSIIVDLGWFFWRHSVVLDAAREGCRVGSDTIDSSSSSRAAGEADIEYAALTHAESVLEAHGLRCEGDCSITATWGTDVGSGYELLTTRVEYPFQPLFGMWPGMQGPVVAQFTMFTAVQI